MVELSKHPKLEQDQVLPQSGVVLLTLLSERGFPRTTTPPPLPSQLLPAGGLVQGQKLRPVQDIVPVSGSAPGLTARHDGEQR